MLCMYANPQLVLYGPVIYSFRLPEAICCCLLPLNVGYKPVMGIFMLLTNLLPEAIVYKPVMFKSVFDIVVLMYTNVHGHLC